MWGPDTKQNLYVPKTRSTGLEMNGGIIITYIT
jgi:hypothetical protein